MIRDFQKRVEELTDKVLAKCDAEGVDKDVLLYLIQKEPVKKFTDQEPIEDIFERLFQKAKEYGEWKKGIGK